MDASRRCQCNDCDSHTLADCINQKCDCYDLEDSFTMLIKRENMDVGGLKKGTKTSYTIECSHLQVCTGALQQCKFGGGYPPSILGSANGD